MSLFTFVVERRSRNGLNIRLTEEKSSEGNSLTVVHWNKKIQQMKVDYPQMFY